MQSPRNGNVQGAYYLINDLFHLRAQKYKIRKENIYFSLCTSEWLAIIPNEKGKDKISYNNKIHQFSFIFSQILKQKKKKI